MYACMYVNAYVCLNVLNVFMYGYSILLCSHHSQWQRSLSTSPRICSHHRQNSRHSERLPRAIAANGFGCPSPSHRGSRGRSTWDSSGFEGHRSPANMILSMWDMTSRHTYIQYIQINTVAMKVDLQLRRYCRAGMLPDSCFGYHRLIEYWPLPGSEEG